MEVLHGESGYEASITDEMRVSINYMYFVTVFSRREQATKQTGRSYSAHCREVSKQLVEHILECIHECLPHTPFVVETTTCDFSEQAENGGENHLHTSQ